MIFMITLYKNKLWLCKWRKGKGTCYKGSGYKETCIKEQTKNDDI